VAFPLRVFYSPRSPGIVVPFAPAANRHVLSAGVFDPGKDRPANALGAYKARQGLRRELSRSVAHRAPDLINNQFPSRGGGGNLLRTRLRPLVRTHRDFDVVAIGARRVLLAARLSRGLRRMAVPRCSIAKEHGAGPSASHPLEAGILNAPPSSVSVLCSSASASHRISSQNFVR
jgi:hypothetical protein